MMFVGTSFGANENKGMHGLHGKIVSVDGSKITVRSHKDGDAESTTVVTDSNTTVTIDGKPSSVGELKEGLFVHVSPTEGTAVTIVATTTRPEHKGGKKKKSETTTPTTNPSSN
jgi:hypothetical protein